MGILLSVSILFCVNHYDVHIFQAVKSSGASPDTGQRALAELFCQIEKVFRRLDTYLKVTPTAEMKKITVKIIVEVLSILAVATRMLERGKMSKSITVGGRPQLAYPC
jgi:hypothetical protein